MFISNTLGIKTFMNMKFFFDYNRCLWKQKLKLKVGSHTQLNLSSNVTAYVFV